MHLQKKGKQKLPLFPESSQDNSWLKESELVELRASDPGLVLESTVMILDALSDGDALYGRSAFLKPHSAAVAIKEFGRTIRRILEVTVATEDLEHLVGNETNGVDGEQLADCSFSGTYSPLLSRSKSSQKSMMVQRRAWIIICMLASFTRIA